MRRIRAFTALLAGLLLGCGVSSTTKPTTAPPHGGSIVNLPDGKGFAEIVTTPAKRGDTTQSEFRVYFLGPDRTTALTPAPSSAALTINGPGGERNVELKPANDGWASAPAASLLQGHDLDGSLSAEIGGQSIKVPIGGR